MRSRIKLGLAMIAGGVFLALSGTASATLIGDHVTATLSTMGSSFSVDTQFVSPQLVGGGTEFVGTFMFATLPMDVSVDVTASGFVISFIQAGTWGGSESGSEIVRISLTDLDWFGVDGFITGLSVNADSRLGVSSTGFGPDWAFVAFKKFSVAMSATVELDVTHDVPEPASLALFGFGLLGLGLVRRRRKTA